VLLTGLLHTLVHRTVNANRISMTVQSQAQGISGVGLITGESYRGTGVTRQHFGHSSTDGQVEETFINNFRIIGPGPNNNFLVHNTLHVAMNASGELTSHVENVSVDCK
jgi:hypothetical protein